MPKRFDPPPPPPNGLAGVLLPVLLGFDGLPKRDEPLLADPKGLDMLAVSRTGEQARDLEAETMSHHASLVLILVEDD